MADTATLATNMIQASRQFMLWFNNLQALANEISTNSNLPGEMVPVQNRPDIQIADINNWVAAVQALNNHLNAAGSSVTPPVNLAKVRMAYDDIN